MHAEERYFSNRQEIVDGIKRDVTQQERECYRSCCVTSLLRQKFVKNRRNILKHFEIKHETINIKNIVIISD